MFTIKYIIYLNVLMTYRDTSDWAYQTIDIL